MSASPEFSPPGTPANPQPVDCSAGQSGHVWFLGGTFVPTSASGQVVRDDVYRTCNIIRGRFLFFPVLNDEFDNLTCDASGKPTSADFTADQLTAAAKTTIDDIVGGSMSVTIDGASLRGLQNANSPYRSPSPWFSYTLPADNFGQFVGCNFPAGQTPPLVDGHPGATADGVYIMLAPLSPGTHTIHFGGEINIPSNPLPAPPVSPIDFIENINYTITVTAG